MKQIKLTTAALLCGIFVFTSCDKHNNGNNIDNAVYAAFEREFPGATDVSWSTNGNYAVVSFDWDGSRSGNDTDYTAWFEKNTAKFMMHEHDMSFSSIPQTVKTAFEESSYSKSPWVHEDEVDVIKRIYTKTDYNRNSSKLPAEALNFIQTNYQNYGIDDIEYYETASKGNFYSVEIEGSHDNDIELYFDTEGNKMESKPDFID